MAVSLTNKIPCNLIEAWQSTINSTTPCHAIHSTTILLGSTSNNHLQSHFPKPLRISFHFSSSWPWAWSETESVQAALFVMHTENASRAVGMHPSDDEEEEEEGIKCRGPWIPWWILHHLHPSSYSLLWEFQHRFGCIFPSLLHIWKRRQDKTSRRLGWSHLITVIMAEGEGRRWNKVVGTSSERRTSYLAYKSRVCVLGEGAYDENNLFKTRSQNYLMALLGAEETLMNFQYSKESYFGINIFVLLE